MKTNQREKNCLFSKYNLDEIDYKDNSLLINYLSTNRKIIPRKYTGTSSKHQRKLAKAIKRARFMALLQYIPE